MRAQLQGQTPVTAIKLARVHRGEPLRVVDLFAGCGGMSLGFHRAGYTILGGVEIDTKAAESHAQNFFGNCETEVLNHHLTARDIRTFPPQQFMQEVLQEEQPENLVDVIVGGPPCQAFARIGRAKLREILHHPQAFLTDDRASLYLHYLEYVEFFRPLAVVMENVPDIMNYGGQNVAEEIACSLEDMGYRCQYTILNTAHYGVPQLRQRFFLIALIDDLHIDPVFPKPTHFIEQSSGYINVHSVALGPHKANLESNTVDLFGRLLSHYVVPPVATVDLPPSISTEQALGDLPAITTHLNGEAKRGIRNFDTLAQYRSDINLSTYARLMRTWPEFAAQKGVYDHVTRYLPRDGAIFRLMQPGDQYPAAHAIALNLLDKAHQQLSDERGQRVDKRTKEFKQLKKSILPPYDPTKFPNKWWKMVASAPSRTLTAHIGKDTYSHIHYDSAQARVISVREAARLQSFPDGFQFTGPMNPAFKQIGNAVPPLQALAIALQIKRLLQRAVVKVLKEAIPKTLAPQQQIGLRRKYAQELSDYDWSQQEIAFAFEVSQSTVSQWLKHARNTSHRPDAIAISHQNGTYTRDTLPLKSAQMGAEPNNTTIDAPV